MDERVDAGVRKTPVYNAYVHGRLGASSSGEKKTCSRAVAEVRGENRRTGDAQNPNVICNIHQRRRYVDDGIMRRVYTGIVNSVMRIYIVIMRRIMQEVVSADCVIAQLYSLSFPLSTLFSLSRFAQLSRITPFSRSRFFIVSFIRIFSTARQNSTRLCVCHTSGEVAFQLHRVQSVG